LRNQHILYIYIVKDITKITIYGEGVPISPLSQRHVEGGGSGHVGVSLVVMVVVARRQPVGSPADGNGGEAAAQ